MSIHEEIAGNCTVNTVPSPSVLLTDIIPPCFSTIVFATGKHRPVPLEESFLVLSARKKGTKILSMVSSCIPIPVSATVRKTLLFSEVILTFIKPFCGIIYCFNIE